MTDTNTYTSCTRVRVGDISPYDGVITKITKRKSKNLLGRDISVITFTFENGNTYTASAESWSPEDVPFTAPVRVLTIKQ